MRFPLHITTDNIKHQITQAIKGNRRYPFVLMLEPLYTCNLACLGCATERHTGKLKDRLPVSDCLRAVDQSGAPAVSLCGGEPTLYPELPDLVEEIIARHRHIYLCTNGLTLEKSVFDRILPHKRLTLNIHLDGLRETHDYVVDRTGVFDHAIDMIIAAKRRGYHVITNTTVYKESSVEEVEDLCAYLFSDAIKVDGMLITPGYHYESVPHDIFLTEKDIEEKFRQIRTFSAKYRIISTPMFLEFAAGLRDYPCSPWSTVTYTPRGWKGPCYLIGEHFYDTWDEFWEGTDWTYWASRKDDRCRNCKMHSGFEASVLRNLPEHPGDIFRLAAWNFMG